MKNISLSSRLKNIFEAEKLTIYGAAVLIAAETDESVKTAHRRLSRWLQKEPKTWTEIEAALAALGYKIEITRPE